MHKDFWKSLFHWLETASLIEIAAKQSILRETLKQISDRELRSDIRRILRFMDEEILARTELDRAMARSASVPLGG